MVEKIQKHAEDKVSDGKILKNFNLCVKYAQICGMCGSGQKEVNSTNLKK